MGVYNNNKDGTRSTLANTIQVVDAPMEQFVSRGEFSAVTPSDVSADNKLVAENEVTKAVDTMPTASSSLVGTIVQYIGTTTASYTNGYFYKCVSDGALDPTYSWVEVISGGSGATSLSGLSDVQLSQTIIDGHALRYDSTSGKWQNAPISPKVESRVELPTTITLEPNRVYIWFQPTVELDISLNVNHNRVFAEEFHFMFLSSSTPTELSLPSDVIIPDDFSIEANKVYEISILDSLLLYNSWTIPEQEEEP